MFERDAATAAGLNAYQIEDIGRLHPDQLVELADGLDGAGAERAARLLYLALLLRSGASPDEADWRRSIRRRLRLPDDDDEVHLGPGQACTALDLAVRELRALLQLTPPPETVGEPVSSSTKPLTGADDQRLEDAVNRLLRALHKPAAPSVFAEIAQGLQDLRTAVLTAPDHATAEDPYDLGRAALGRYLSDMNDFAYAPLGSTALLHALARTSATGVGSLGLRTGDLCRNGREALALLQLALGVPLTRAAEARCACGVLLLAQRAPDWLRRELVDELGDLGLVRPLRALMDVEARDPSRCRDRELLQRLRDAALDLDDLQLGWDAQHLLAQSWGDDKNEWQALAELTARRGAFAEAESYLEKALWLDPGSEHARERLEWLRAGDHGRFADRGGFGSSPDRRRLRAERRASPAPEALADEVHWLEIARSGGIVAAELAPRPPPQKGWRPEDGLHLRGLGRQRELSVWGECPVFRGVDVVRGFYVADRPMREVSVRLGGRVLARSAPSVHPVEDDDRGRLKSVFNLWLSSCAFAPGRYELELQVADGDGVVHTYRDHVLVAAAVSEDEAASSDAVVDPPSGDAFLLEAAINARPSQVRPARRVLMASSMQRVLVLRVDQLGDLVASIPALVRLRELLPQAQITGLVTSANGDLARSLGLFDDVVVIEFPSDPIERRRVMPIDRQLALRAQLHARRFDLAIDLADASPSRHLLRLSGAKRLVGMDGQTYGFLDNAFTARARDPFNGSEDVSASTKMLALVEALGTTMTSPGVTLRRGDLPPSRLHDYGVTERSYVVLHTGARLQFSRWPHYPKLARLVLERTELAVILISEGPALMAGLRPDVLEHERFRLIDQALPFDALDLLLHHCAAFVGNDSGPKHLASLRGSEVVSLHCARNNWNEWGQDAQGVIISRRVPCAGCQIRDYPDECGKDFVCLTAITPEEVFEVLTDRLTGVGRGQISR
jgi:ADP-heptose:LPS heptosyltransferase/tetratricopeptide (TPR) repeat protein